MTRRLCRAPPSIENAYRAHQWTSRVPGLADLTGQLSLFDDQRIRWLLQQVDVHDAVCLDLGALEGGHSFMLARAGARRVDAVEADLDNLVKLMLVRESLGLLRVRPLLGDAAQVSGDYDLVLACGILYHLTEPELALRRWCELAPALYLWTHYWDPADQRLERQDEASAIWRYPDPTHLDGVAEYAVWLTPDRILQVLEDMGMECTVRASAGHPHGPVLELLARRKPCAP